MIRTIFTLEMGYIQDDNEKFCLNEFNFLDYDLFKQKIQKTLCDTIFNSKAKGFYIEAYADKMEITQEDIATIEQSNTLRDCAMKTNFIQQFIIDNSGEIIDYVYN